MVATASRARLLTLVQQNLIDLICFDLLRFALICFDLTRLTRQRISRSTKSVRLSISFSNTRVCSFALRTPCFSLTLVFSITLDIRKIIIFACASMRKFDWNGFALKVFRIDLHRLNCKLKKNCLLV